MSHLHHGSTPQTLDQIPALPEEPLQVMRVLGLEPPLSRYYNEIPIYPIFYLLKGTIGVGRAGTFLQHPHVRPCVEDAIEHIVTINITIFGLIVRALWGWGVPKVMGTFLGALIMRIIAYWGLY